MEIKFKEKLKLPKQEIKKEEKSESISTEVGEVAECLMNTAKSLHKLHLKIKGQGSFAAHNALSIYENMHEWSDIIVEEYQGATGVIIDIPSKAEEKIDSVESAIIFLRKLKVELSNLQSVLSYSEIINKIDEFKSVINKTIYKLTFLK